MAVAAYEQRVDTLDDVADVLWSAADVCGGTTVFAVFADVFGDAVRTTWDYVPVEDDGNPFWSLQAQADRCVTGASRNAVEFVVADDPDDSHTFEVLVWHTDERVRLRNACRELGCCHWHLPVHEWFLTCAVVPAGGGRVWWQGRRGVAHNRVASLLAPILGIGRLLQRMLPGLRDGNGDADDDYRRYFARLYAENGKTDVGWTVDASEDDTHGVAWHVRAPGALLIDVGGQARDHLLPTGQRNLPRSVDALRQRLFRYLWDVHAAHPDPPEAERLRLEQHTQSDLFPGRDEAQRWLDAVHASNQPAVRLALRLNVARFSVFRRPEYLGTGYRGTPSLVAYHASFRWLSEMAMLQD